ncbi:MAG: hypothetical protein L3J21_12135 [Devosiaceae bacterium]|nr:hypothetical protein [Devosiaceae bacterium]
MRCFDVKYISKTVGTYSGLLMLLFMFLSSSQAFSQTTSAIEISADKFVVRAVDNESEFSGNVVITQTGLKVWADRVIVHYGAGGTTDISSFEAVGGVKIVSEQQTATGNRAVYDPKTRLLRLTGNVIVVNDSGTVNAEELLVNLSSNVTEFSSGGDGQRVTGLFTPGN